MPEVSVVVPLLNEEDNVEPLIRECAEVLERAGTEHEIILVDDGSTDGTYERIRETARNRPRVSAIRLRRNFGQTAALSAGIDHASGKVIVLMDGDLQNDPSDIPRLLEGIRNGNDVVSGWRRRRKDPWLRSALSRFANGLISLASGVQLHDYGCTLKAYRREILEDIHLHGEMHRFIPIYARQVGAKIAELEVNHRPRVSGRSKYGFSRVPKVLLDLVVAKFMLGYMQKPIYFFGAIGVAAVFLAVTYWVLVTSLNAMNLSLPVTLPPTSVFLALVGVLCILVGILAELSMRTYYEAQGRKPYRIRDKIP